MVAMKVGMDNGKTTKIQGQNTERWGQMRRNLQSQVCKRKIESMMP
jgi:hypothetical protein